jgi:hypothetical protein
MTAQPRAELFRLASGFMITKAIGAAVQLGLPELVSERNRSAAELASAAGADPDAITRLLRALASVGVFTDDDGVIRHTPMSELLARDAAGSFAAQALVLSGYQYLTWGESLESFRTGLPAFPAVHGQPIFDWLAEHPEQASQFNEAMSGGASLRREPLLDRDWSGVSTVVDVGGGSGSTVIALLLAHPHLRGVVFDLPHVEGEARAAIEQAELSARCRYVGGSFFDSVPPGADVYVMSAILHDWDDAAAGAILQTLRAAMRPDSRLLLLESVLADGDEPDVAKITDLHMLVALGGRERTEPQWRSLLTEAGFRIDGIRSGLIEARPHQS